MFEKASWPRIKPCGGALTVRALGYLPAGYQPWLKSHPTAWTFCGGLPPVTVARDVPYCHTVVRSEFDHWLWREAALAGAKAHEAEPVLGVAQESAEAYRLTTPFGCYRARYLVGADGAKGVVVKQLGFQRPDRGAAVEVETEVPEAIWDQYRDRCRVDVTGYAWGYAWVIPKDKRLNIGVGSFRPTQLNLRQSLRQYLASLHLNPDLKPLAHPLPYRWRPALLSRGRALLVGDAAGLMDPFSAEGIIQALDSARRAARAIGEAEREGQTHIEGYDRDLAREVWPRHREAAMMARVFYTVPGFWSRVFARDQGLIHEYLALAEGRSHYGTLLAATRHRLLTNLAGIAMSPAGLGRGRRP